jgi:hypothetical protein
MHLALIKGKDVMKNQWNVCYFVREPTPVG